MHIYKERKERNKEFYEYLGSHSFDVGFENAIVCFRITVLMSSMCKLLV